MCLSLMACSKIENLGEVSMLSLVGENENNLYGNVFNSANNSDGKKVENNLNYGILKGYSADEMLALCNSRERDITAVRKGNLFYSAATLDNSGDYSFTDTMRSEVYRLGCKDIVYPDINLSEGDAIVQFKYHPNVTSPSIAYVESIEYVLPYQFEKKGSSDYLRVNNILSRKSETICHEDILIDEIENINGESWTRYYKEYGLAEPVNTSAGFIKYNPNDDISFSGYNGSTYSTVEFKAGDYDIAALVKLESRTTSTGYEKLVEMRIGPDDNVRTHEGYFVLVDKDNNVPTQSGYYMFGYYLIKINK